MKENDWIVAGLNNPNYSTSEFLVSGLNLDNTQMLSQEFYRNTPFVKEHFTQNGTFDEQAFDSYYKKRVSEFNNLQNMDVQDNFLYSPFDPRAMIGNKKTKDPKFGFDVVPNTNRDTIMLTGAIYSDPYSMRERAQQNHIFDVATGTWSKDVLNDRALIKNPLKYLKTIFSEPLVYATYDSDGEHYDMFTGQMVPHYKGEYKINQYGLPYTETLNGRSLIGKEVVSAGDIITIDKQGIDKYNFFDSDDIEKSITGTIMKTAASVAPLLIPYVNTFYSGVLVGRELLKTLPMLYGVTSAWFDMPEENRTLNTLAGYGEAFTGSTSDYGRSKVLNAETLSSLISDVALQWSQQKTIANAVSKLRGSKDLMGQAAAKAKISYDLERAHLESLLKEEKITTKVFETVVGKNADDWAKSAFGSSALKKFTNEVEPIIKRSNRIGADVSLAYMALVSNTDVYSSMLEHGASRKEAAAVTLGSTIGMFSVDRFLGLGEMFFDDLTTNTERAIRATVTKEAGSWFDKVFKSTIQNPTLTTLEKTKNLFKSGIDFGKKSTNKFIDNMKYHSLGFRGKAFGEGLEEVTEELVTDISKSIYELMGAMGMDTSTKDVGAWDDMLPRYGMSFLGGLIGGGLFYGVDVYQNGTFNVDRTQEELIYLVRNGKTNELLQTLDDFRKKGKLGSKSLSSKVTKDEDGSDVFLSAESEADSQNEFIYNRIKETILSLDAIINEEGGKLDEDELFDKMVFQEIRFTQLKDKLGTVSYTTGYQEDYQKALSDVLNLRGALDRANRTTTGIAYETEAEMEKYSATDEKLRHMTEQEKETRNKNLKKLQDAYKKAQDHLNKFLSGEYSLDYTEKMMFTIDESLNSDFIALNFEQWLEKYHSGLTVNELSPAQLDEYKGEYLEYARNIRNREIDERFQAYKYIRDKFISHLQKVSDNQENFIKYQEEITKLMSEEDSPLFNMNFYKFDDIFDFDGETESSESYVRRNEVEFFLDRKKKLMRHNLQQEEALRVAINDIIDKSGGFIDPITRRDLKLILSSRKKDILKSIRQNLLVDLSIDNTGINLLTGLIDTKGLASEMDKGVIEILSSLDQSNLQNAEQVLQRIKDFVSEQHRRASSKHNSTLGGLITFLSETPFGDFLDPESDSILGTELQQAIEAYIPDTDSVEESLVGSNTDLFDSDNYEDYGITSADLENFLEIVKSAYAEGTLDELEIGNIDQDGTNNPVLQADINKYQRIFEQYLDDITSNPMLKLNQELDNKLKDVNPVIDLVRSLGLSMNVNMNNLESILQKLDTYYEEAEDINDIILTSEERESLEEAKIVIKLAQAYLNAMSTRPTILAPFGRNAAINEFAEHHKDIYKDRTPLPVLSRDVADMYHIELSKYLRQIGVENPETGEYNPGSWLQLSNSNESDKSKQHIRAGKAWCKTYYDFFSSMREHFKFKYNDTNHDLLEGFETIPPVTNDTEDGLVIVAKISSILYKQVQKHIKDGWTYTQLWERSGILQKISTAEGASVMDQVTCSINEKLKEEGLSLYDRAMLVITSASTDPVKFYSEIKSRINEDQEIVPLTIQEWLTRIGISFIDNADIFNESLQYLSNIPSNKSQGKVFVPNVLAVPGDAGGGKSRVIGRNIAKHVPGDKIWISAPKDSQIDTLFKATTKGAKFLNREKSESDDVGVLIEAIGVDQEAYQEAMKQLKDLSKEETLKENGSEYFVIQENEEMLIPVPNYSKFGIKKIDNAPEVIIIDEATHLSSLEIQLYGEFGRLNGTKIILLGDNKQRGFNGIGRNWDREGLFMARTPELGITLRDNNIQHQYNLNQVKDIISTLNKVGFKESDKAIVDSIRENLKNLRFKVYDQEEINGDLIVDNLSDATIEKLSGTVGYVGGNSTTYESLKRILGADNVVKMSKDDIQGQEFDYVVVDSTFNIPTDFSSLSLLEFMQDLYTMISRGMTASIIVDSGHSLQNYIGENRFEFTKAKSVSIMQYAKEFIDQTVKLYDEIIKGEQSVEQKESPTTPAGVPQVSPSVSTTVTQSSGMQVTSSSKNDIPVVSASDLRASSLDFNKNIYGILQIPEGGSLQINDDINIDPSQLLLATSESDIDAVIEVQEKGEAVNNSQAFILMTFPKVEFKKEGFPLDQDAIVEKLPKNDNLVTVPIKYIDSIVSVPPTTLREDTKTHKKDIEPVPVISKEDVDAMIINETDILGNQEDYPSQPMLAYGNATFTGLNVEIRDGKQVYIQPSVDYTGMVIGESKTRSGSLPAIKSYKEDNDGFIHVILGSKTKKGVTSHSQTYTSIDNLVEDSDGQWLRENTKDTEFKVAEIVIRPNGEISATFDAVEFNDGTVGTYQTLIKRVPFDFPRVKRDMQIFTTQAEIADNKDQIDLVTKLRTLKGAYLNNHTYRELPRFITDLVSEEEFNNIQWFLEVRPKNDQDNLIRNIGMTEVKPIHGDLIFTVVGEFKMKNGALGRVTLGLMSDPNTWIQSIRNQDIQNKLRPKIKKFKNILTNPNQVLSEIQRTAIEAKVRHWDEYLKSLDLENENSQPNVYKAFIEKVAGMYNPNTGPVVIPIPRIITPGLTDLRSTTQPGQSRDFIRLSRKADAMIANIQKDINTLSKTLEKLKGNSYMTKKIKGTIQRHQNKIKKLQEIKERSFFSLNPNTIVSPMYIYTPTLKNRTDIDDSVIGRYNVMFVTNDPLLSEADLMETYIYQKNATELERLSKGYLDLKESNTPHSVRMVVLNPIGISFQDLSNPYLRESMRSTVTPKSKDGTISSPRTNIFPFKTNYMGARMYVSLWNFRANLLQFNEQFINFVDRVLKPLGISEDDFDNYLKVKDLRWRKDNGEKLDSEEKSFLAQYSNLPNFDEVSKAVDEFNDSLADTVKQFRLGSDLENGAYIRKLTGDLSLLYDTDESVNGIYINFETMKKYITLMNKLFENVLDYVVTCNMDKNRLLSPKKSGVKNSFAYHLTTIANGNGEILVDGDPEHPDGVTIKFGSKYDPELSRGIMNTFSHIPAVLSQTFKYTSIRQMHLSQSEFDTEGDYSIKIKGTITNSEGKEENIEKTIPYSKIWDELGILNGHPDDEYLLDNYVFDDTLSNMFSFAFHGTLQDVNRGEVHRASDALFPNGFYADPLSSVTDKDGNALFTKSIQQTIFFGADVLVGDPTFYISMGDLQDSLNSFVQNTKGRTDQETKRLEQVQQSIDIIRNTMDQCQNNPNMIGELQALLEETQSSSDPDILRRVQQDIINVIGTEINKSEGIFQTKGPIDPNTIRSIDGTNPVTLGQMITQKFKELGRGDLPPISVMNGDGNVISVVAGDFVLEVRDTLSGDLDIAIIGAPEVKEPILVTKVKGLIDFLVSKKAKDTDIELIQGSLENYQKASEENKQIEKNRLIERLTDLASRQRTQRKLSNYKKIQEILNEIKDINCK